MKPFFERAADRAGGGSMRRLILISYHFPPAETAGALRWQKLARIAWERGWNLDVLCLDPGALASADHGRLDDLPPGTRVFGIPLREPLPARGARSVWKILQRFRRRSTGAGGAAANGWSDRPDSLGRQEIRWELRSLRTPVRAFFAWMDFIQYGGWARSAAEFGAVLARSTRYEAVISCGPPHMAHEGARLLAKRIRLPFVMDLRDPWSLWQRLPEHHASPLWLQQARRYERRCVRDASLVVVNTEPLRQQMQALHPAHAGRMIAVMNGFDEEDVVPSGDRSRFLIAYSGTVYIDRDPRPLFAAAARVIREHALTPSRFGIEFMGVVQPFEGRSLEESASAEGIAEFVRVHPPRPRRQALAFMAKASVLVILPQDSDLAIPSKLFEYTRYPAWLLALAHRGSAIEQLLRDTQADVVDQSDVDGIAQVLRTRYIQHQGGERPTPLAESEPQLSRRAQGARLFDALEQRIGRAAAAGTQRTSAFAGGAPV